MMLSDFLFLFFFFLILHCFLLFTSTERDVVKDFEICNLQMLSINRIFGQMFYVILFSICSLSLFITFSLTIAKFYRICLIFFMIIYMFTDFSLHVFFILFIYL